MNIIYSDFNNRSMKLQFLSQGTTHFKIQKHIVAFPQCLRCFQLAGCLIIPFRWICPSTFRNHPRSEINITTPINWVNNNTGVKNDHTCHKATLKQMPATIKAAVVMGIKVGYLTS